MLVNDKDFDLLRQEMEYGNERWGTNFDALNTINDWVTYITMYASSAAMIQHKDDPDAIAAFFRKAAGLALTASVRADLGLVAPRHYDESLDHAKDPKPHGNGINEART